MKEDTCHAERSDKREMNDIANIEQLIVVTLVTASLVAFLPQYNYEATGTAIMKGTKVQTLGAGREVLPHNMAVTKMRLTYAPSSYAHARYC